MARKAQTGSSNQSSISSFFFAPASKTPESRCQSTKLISVLARRVEGVQPIAVSPSFSDARASCPWDEDDSFGTGESAEQAKKVWRVCLFLLSFGLGTNVTF